MDLASHLSPNSPNLPFGESQSTDSLLFFYYNNHRRVSPPPHKSSAVFQLFFFHPVLFLFWGYDAGGSVRVNGKIGKRGAQQWVWLLCQNIHLRSLGMLNEITLNSAPSSIARSLVRMWILINVDSSVYLLDFSFIDVLRIEFQPPTLHRYSSASANRDKNGFFIPCLTETSSWLFQRQTLERLSLAVWQHDDDSAAFCTIVSIKLRSKLARNSEFEWYTRIRRIVNEKVPRSAESQVARQKRRKTNFYSLTEFSFDGRRWYLRSALHSPCAIFKLYSRA